MQLLTHASRISSPKQGSLLLNKYDEIGPFPHALSRLFMLANYSSIPSIDRSHIQHNHCQRYRQQSPSPLRAIAIT